MLAALAGVGSVVTSIGGFFGNLFGGPEEDKSSIGFDSYMQRYVTLPAYPTEGQLLSAGQSAGWPKSDLKAIEKTYSQATGTAKDGDWNMVVTSVTPITVKWFKGAGEQFTRASEASFSSAPASPSGNPATNAIFGNGNTEKNGTPASAGISSAVTWIIAGVGLVLVVVITFVISLFNRKR